MTEPSQLATTQPQTIKALLSQENVKNQIAKALPTHLSTDRFLRVAMTALLRTPKLAECTQASFMKCLLDLSAFGLEPDGRRAHLIPYGRECTLILDYKGLVELAMRSGLVAKIHADVVCEHDEFSYNLGEVVTHKINFREPRGEVYAAYALAVTKDGPTFCQVMSREEIEGIRARSRAGKSGPWVTDWSEMAKKTAFRRLAKWLPLSAEFRDAVEKEDETEPEIRDVTPSARQTPEFTPLDAPQLPQDASDGDDTGSETLTLERLSERLETAEIPVVEFIERLRTDGWIERKSKISRLEDLPESLISRLTAEMDGLVAATIGGRAE